MRPPDLICVAALALAAAILITSTTECSAQTIRGYYPLENDFTNTDGHWQITKNKETELVLFGSGFTNGSSIFFTESPDDCDVRVDEATIKNVFANGTEARVTVTLSRSIEVYFCVGETHQDVTIEAVTPPGDVVPLPLSIIFLIVLLALSGLFSGLNLGLMSLAPSELEVVSESGEGKDAKYASIILPLRRRGNLLLCTVLLGNVLVNSTLAIFLDGLFGGLAGVLGSTAGIVIFGEIMPQSICSRHALAVGAHTIWLTKFFMVATFPVAYPISLLLDFILGDEVGAVYMRKQLLHLLKMQDPYNDLGRDEMDIITGALTYKTKTAADVMTKLEDVFMLAIDSILDFKTVSRVMEDGHSRIPTYRGQRDNIVGLLYVKDLAFIDPDDKTPLETVIKYYKHPIEEVFVDTNLDSMLELFKKGRTHMVMVIDINNEVPDHDPVREVVGIATLEDVIEEIIQDEIIDETDKYLDNKTKAIVKREERKRFVAPTEFADQHTQFRLSDTVALAVFSYLSTQYEEFSPNIIGPSVLKKLLSRQECVRMLNKEDLSEEEQYLYKEGQVADFFTLVVEGSLTVTVGKDRFTFEAGPYHTICLSALTQPGFVCDFDAKIKSDNVVLLSIPRKLYLEAVAASKIANKREHGILTLTPNIHRKTPTPGAGHANGPSTTTTTRDDDDDDDGNDTPRSGGGGGGSGGGERLPYAGATQTAPGPSDPGHGEQDAPSNQDTTAATAGEGGDAGGGRAPLTASYHSDQGSSSVMLLGDEEKGDNGQNDDAVSIV